MILKLMAFGVIFSLILLNLVRIHLTALLNGRMGHERDESLDVLSLLTF